jgi:hypothetical protein
LYRSLQKAKEEYELSDLKKLVDAKNLEIDTLQKNVKLFDSRIKKVLVEKGLVALKLNQCALKSEILNVNIVLIS